MAQDGQLSGEDIESKSLSLGFALKGTKFTDQSRFELELGVLNEDENKIFQAEIIAIGNFIFDSELQADTLNKYFYINAPAILFPYVRAYLSTLTTLSGLKPINLPTLNLSNLGPELEKNTSSR